MARFILQVLNGTLPEIPGVVEEENEPRFATEPPGVIKAENVQLKLMLAARDKEIESLKN